MKKNWPFAAENVKVVIVKMYAFVIEEKITTKTGV